MLGKRVSLASCMPNPNILPEYCTKMLGSELAILLAQFEVPPITWCVSNYINSFRVLAQVRIAPPKSSVIRCQKIL